MRFLKNEMRFYPVLLSIWFRHYTKFVSCSIEVCFLEKLEVVVFTTITGQIGSQNTYVGRRREAVHHSRGATLPATKSATVRTSSETAA